MTAIVGFTDGKKVCIGGDSAGVRGLDIVLRHDGKVFPVGEFLIGVAGSPRFAQLLRYSFKPPKHAKTISDNDYMATAFVDAMRYALKAGGSMMQPDGQELSGGTAMVAYRGQLYTIEEDFQIGKAIEPYAAIGCGEPFARGALYALRSSGLPVEEQVQLALLAAEHCSGGVKQPFNIEWTGSDARRHSGRAEADRRGATRKRKPVAAGGDGGKRAVPVARGYRRRRVTDYDPAHPTGSGRAPHDGRTRRGQPRPPHGDQF